MNIIIEKNTRLKKIIGIVEDIKDLAYIIDTKQYIINNIKLYDGCIIFCNAVKSINTLKKIKGKNIIVFTDNLDDKFVYDIIHALHPQDMININNSEDSIKQRLCNNLYNYARN